MSSIQSSFSNDNNIRQEGHIPILWRPLSIRCVGRGLKKDTPFTHLMERGLHKMGMRPTRMMLAIMDWIEAIKAAQCSLSTDKGRKSRFLTVK
jgi:hypothetical protein